MSKKKNRKIKKETLSVVKEEKFSFDHFSVLKTLVKDTKNLTKTTKTIVKQEIVEEEIQKQSYLNSSVEITDEELFLSALGDIKLLDVHTEKFSQQKTFKSGSKEDEPPHLLLSDMEKEIAIFNQEMAMSKVSFLGKKPVKTKPNHTKRKPVIDSSHSNTIHPTERKNNAPEKNTQSLQCKNSVKKIEINPEIMQQAQPDFEPSQQPLESCDDKQLENEEKKQNPSLQLEQIDETKGAWAYLDHVKDKADLELLESVQQFEMRFGPLSYIDLRLENLIVAKTRVCDFLDCFCKSGIGYAWIICGAQKYSSELRDTINRTLKRFTVPYKDFGAVFLLCSLKNGF